MVLVDTSIWVRALSNQEPFVMYVDGLLNRDEITGHEYIYGELLIGDRGGRGKFLGAYEQIHWAHTVSHDEVVAFVRGRKLYGRGVGWIDVHLLASAMVGGLRLWTADSQFAVVAEELGIAYKPPVF